MVTAQADIVGAGATFPYPIYYKWAEGYKKATGVSLNYQSIGSSGGIRQINAKTVDFGATDAPVSGENLDKNGQVQFPAIIGGTVPVINLDGFKPGELRITGPVLADVYLGNITKWNDPRLTALNPGKQLPDQPITLVTKFRLTELQKSLVEHKKTFETLRDELITKLGTKDADGNVSIPMYLESASEEAPKEINPVFIQFNQEFEAVLSETREITTQKFDISEFDFKTDENYPVFFKVLEIATSAE